MLRLSVEVSEHALGHGWLVQTALTVAILLLFYSVIRDFVQNKVAAGLFRWLGVPLLFLHLLGVLGGLIAILESISVNIGNIEISVYGIARVAIFGSLLFWLGRISSKTGRSFISHQESLDIRTREVAAKLLEVAIFFLISLLILQVMGINQFATRQNTQVADDCTACFDRLQLQVIRVSEPADDNIFILVQQCDAGIGAQPFHGEYSPGSRLPLRGKHGSRLNWTGVPGGIAR